MTRRVRGISRLAAMLVSHCGWHPAASHLPTAPAYMEDHHGNVDTCADTILQPSGSLTHT